MFGIEVDAMPGGFVCSASFKGVGDAAVTKPVSFGKAPIHKVFNKEQRAFYKAHAPEGLELDDLSVLGPIFVVKVRFMPPELAHKLVAELWLYPDGSRIFELSTKCTPSDLIEVYTNVRHYLIERGVDRHGEQQTKTKKALEFFSADLEVVRGRVGASWRSSSRAGNGARSARSSGRPTKRSPPWSRS